MRKLLAAAITAIVVLAPVGAQAKPMTYMAGYPRCITTTWASHYYHAPKTRWHQYCYLPLAGYQIKGDLAYWRSGVWYPASWTFIGPIMNEHGKYVGMLMRNE